MPGRRIPDELGRVWCLGPCERLLPVNCFDHNRHGNPDALCKTCENWRNRNRVRRRYHKDEEYRERTKANRRMSYQRNRAAEVAGSARRRLRAKLRFAA
jgi:hypothetical protein